MGKRRFVSKRRATTRTEQSSVAASTTKRPVFRFGCSGATSNLGAPPPLQAHAAACCGLRDGSEEESSEDEEGACVICGSAEDEPGCNEILLCDACDAGLHMRCLRPPLRTVPPGDWFCAQCAAHRRKSAAWEIGARAARREPRGGANGRRPTQRNGWLLDVYGQVTDACYACQVCAVHCSYRQ